MGAVELGEQLGDALAVLRLSQRATVGLAIAVILATIPHDESDLVEVGGLLEGLDDNRLELSRSFDDYKNAQNARGSSSDWNQAFAVACSARLRGTGLIVVLRSGAVVSAVFPLEKDIWREPLGDLVGGVPYLELSLFELDQRKIIPDEVVSTLTQGDAYLRLDVEDIGVNPLVSATHVDAPFAVGDVIEHAFQITARVRRAGESFTWNVAGLVSRRYARLEELSASDPRWTSLQELRASSEWLALKGLTLDEACPLITRRIEESKNVQAVGLPIPVVGTISIASHLVVWSAWLAFMTICAFTVVHAQALAARLLMRGPPSGNAFFPWIAMYGGPLATFFTISASMLPAVAFGVLLAAVPGDMTVWGGAGLLVLEVAGAAAAGCTLLVRDTAIGIPVAR